MIPISALLQAAEDAPAPEGRSAASGTLQLWGDLSLADPWFLLLIPLAIVLYVWGRASVRAAGRTPTLPVGGLPRTLRQRLAWIPAALQVLAVCLGIVALARPLRSNVVNTSSAEGVDIALLVDRSSSMQFNDLDPDKSRLEVVKEVVGDFAERRMTDRVGAADSIALISFAQFPELLVPFTLDAEALGSYLDDVELVRYQEEDGTSIGSALAKAVAVLQGSEAKSKIVVLLTDGENNGEEILPAEAAELAASQGVRVYCVLAGRYVYLRDRFNRFTPTEQELDTTDLVHIAETTGGRFFRARNKEALEEVYSEIESLERTPREEHRYLEHFDLYPKLLLAAIAAYLTAWMSAATWARRLT